MICNQKNQAGAKKTLLNIGEPLGNAKGNAASHEMTLLTLFNAF